MTIRCDFHVHSKYSLKPTNWVTKRFGCPESFTEPRYIYDTAMDRGMTHVTITDHNNIRGATKLMELGYKNTFVSCEATAYFPDGCKVHVLVYNITETQFRDINTARKNIYDIVEYLRSEKIWHAIAHPLYSVNNKLSQNHLEQLLVMFDLIELNGFRSKETNDILRSIVYTLSNATLEKIADKYKIENPLINSRKKQFIRGSDDHSGVFVARTYTENEMGDELSVVFNKPEKNIIRGNSCTPQDLSFALYSIGYQYLDTKFNIKKYVHKDKAINTIDKFLGPTETLNGGFLSSLVRKFRGTNGKSIVSNNAKDDVLNIISKIRDIEGISPDNVADKWFDVISVTIDTSIKHLLEYLILQLSTKNIFNVFQAFGNLASLYLLTVPYYVSFYIFQQTKNFSLNLNIENEFASKPKKHKIGHFTDTFYEINGVVKTLRQAQRMAYKFNYDYTFITCYNKQSELGEKVFTPTETYPLPGYDELELNLPPVLKMLDYCYKEGFTHIHTATPGPVGLAGMVIAKILQKPLYSTYHTAFPQYVEATLSDSFMTEMCWQYMRWYYNQCDKIFVPSKALMIDLKNHGIDESRLYQFPRGIDTDFFHPTEKIEDNKFYLLYVGRVSKEKNLDILTEAFKKLDNPNIELIIVGDGPYKSKMEKELKGFSATFTGFLHGDALIQAYQQADLFVFPSTTDTFGNVILEAHACGLPTIVTDMGGPAENVIEDETGIVVKGEDVYALKEGILSLLNKEKIKDMGIKARKEVEKRSFDKAFIDWIAMYE